MTTSIDPVRQRMVAADPAAPNVEPPDELMDADVLLALIDQRSGEGESGRRWRTDVVARPMPRWRPAIIVAAATLALILAVGLPILLLGKTEPVTDETTTTIPSTTTTVPPTTIPPMVESWGRVGHEVMNPVVGLFDIAPLGSGFVAAGWDPGEEDMRQNGAIFTSDDGIAWNRVGEDAPELNQGAVLIYGITEGGPGIVAVGTGCEDDVDRCPPHATVWTSADGSSWTRSSTDPDVFPESSALLDVMNTDSGVVAAGNITTFGEDDTMFVHPVVWLSPNGLDWSLAWQGEPIDMGESFFIPAIHSLTVDTDGTLVAVGAANNAAGELVAAVWISGDGTTWERVEPESPAFSGETTMNAVTWGTNGFVAVGTESGTQPVIWQSADGRTWTRVDVAGQPFDTTGSLGSVDALDAGYIAVGPHAFTDMRGGWVTVWTSRDGLTWDRVHAIGEGAALSVVATDAGIAVAGNILGSDNFHASVWAGPLFDPAAPPPDPNPPMPEDLGGGGEGAPIDPEEVSSTEVLIGGPSEPPPEGEYGTTDVAAPRLPLGEVTETPDSVRLDFLAGGCDDETCTRDAHFIHPDDSNLGTSYWIENTPFHVRHGFANGSQAPLGNGFDVVLFLTRQEGPELADGSFELGQPFRFDSDYVLQGATAKCGPGYWEQTESSTCEWFVHEFPEGIPAGRYDFWAGWYAPCSAWLDLGVVDSCANPDEVTWEFVGAVNTPIFGEEYTEGWFQGPFEPETLVGDPDNGMYWSEIMRGWPEG